jgi:hypothetical protein
MIKVRRQTTRIELENKMPGTRTHPLSGENLLAEVHRWLAWLTASHTHKGTVSCRSLMM